MKNTIKTIIPKFILDARSNYLNNKSQQEFNKRNYEKIEYYLNLREVNLEIGSGAKAGTNGWISSDITKGADLYLDLLKPFPFPNNSIDKIYSSHVLEHFYSDQILMILKECYRVLKPKGWISACVPDASIFIKAYCANKPLDPKVWFGYELAANYILSEIDYINYIGYLNGHHKHLFDTNNLIAFFVKGGFSKVKKRDFINGLDLKVRDYESIYVEGTK
jgi:predicted SAM-dependent methyltransferase